MAALILADIAEGFLEHRLGAASSHLVEDGGGRDLAHQEGAEQHGQAVFGHGRLVARPVAGTVVVEPLGILLQALAQFGLGRVGDRIRMLQELGDGHAAHLLVVLLVLRDAEEAATHSIFLMGLVSLDQCRSEHRWCGSVEHRQQRPPVGDGLALLPSVFVHIERIPRQFLGVPNLAARGIPDFLQLFRVLVPGQRVDVGLLDGRRELHRVGKFFFTHGEMSPCEGI